MTSLPERRPIIRGEHHDVHVMGPLRDRIGVRSFNLALWRGPLDGSWSEFPPIVRLVDRGDPFQRPSDIGAMELYGTPIVGTDPYELIERVSGDKLPPGGRIGH